MSEVAPPTPRRRSPGTGPRRQVPEPAPPPRPRRRLLPAALLAAALGVAAAAGQAALVAAVDRLLPDARSIAHYNRPGTLTILSADGAVLQKLGPATRERLQGPMPQLVERAFIAAEDRRFYQHDGIDPWGIARALVRNLTQGSVEEGASTITQQLARTVFLSQDRTLVRKVKEAALAGKLERQLSKRQILEQYLNVVYLGSGAYGVSDAAWIYFSKTPAQLTLPEAALIAGLPPAPSIYSPLVNPELARRRRATVLRRMREAGFIDDSQLQLAAAAPLNLRPALPKFWDSQAPYFTSWVAQELPGVLSKEQLEVGGLTVRSSLRLDWQRQAQKAIDTYSPGAMEGALVAMEPRTGLVRALVGGNDFSQSQFNRATQALRSPGSTFKLFTYLTALKEGILPDSKVVDRYRCFGGYCPRNFGGRYMGTVSLVTALQNSLNTVAVSLLKQLGFNKVIATANSLGIHRELGRFYPLAVGATEQTVLDMTAAYAAVINRGLYVPPTPFEEIYGPNGQLLWSRRVDGARPERRLDSDIADTMTWMLQQVVKAGTGGGAALADRAVAGKTGTSEGGRDLWFIGSIPQLSTGVWLGYDDSRETKSTSVVATYAWRTFMAAISKDLPVEAFPPRPLLKPKAVLGLKLGPARRPSRPDDDSPGAPPGPAPERQPELLAPIPEGTPTAPPEGPAGDPTAGAAPTPVTGPPPPPTEPPALPPPPPPESPLP